MVKESEQGVFLRTVLRKDLHDELTEFAKLYSTGRGNWDYGVAIQFLLDFYSQHSTIAQVNQKLDVIAEMISQQGQPVEEVKEDDQGTEMLGGEKIK